MIAIWKNICINAPLEMIFMLFEIFSLSGFSLESSFENFHVTGTIVRNPVITRSMPIIIIAMKILEVKLNMPSRVASTYPAAGTTIETVGIKNKVIGIIPLAIFIFVALFIVLITEENMRPRKISTPVHRAPNKTCT